MSFGQYQQPSRNAEEAEKPFWISYADLMTALMILFLVIMVTALASITKKAEQTVKETPEIKEQVDMTKVRLQEISNICQHLSEEVAKTNTSVEVDCKLNRINFGEVGRFQSDQFRLGAEGEQALNQVVPAILSTANTPTGQKWLKQVLIEGFTDTDGSYLYNLNLSLKRSEWVMCTLLRNDQSTAVRLNNDQRQQVKKLFLAGGVAFNHVRDSKDASRRVELRLQFYGVDKAEKNRSQYDAKFEDDAKERCWL
jgi:outer membrane protein OmpA-like peptidoglycan-associated protein